jgi:hypothetical protein
MVAAWSVGYVNVNKLCFFCSINSSNYAWCPRLKDTRFQKENIKCLTSSFKVFHIFTDMHSALWKHVKDGITDGPFNSFKAEYIICQQSSGFTSLNFFFLVLPSSTYLFTVGVEGFYFHLITLKHTPHSVRLLWTRDRPVAETSTLQHKHCTREKFMPPVGFEPMIPASARPQTYALDRTATGVNFPQQLKIMTTFLHFHRN